MEQDTRENHNNVDLSGVLGGVSSRGKEEEISFHTQNIRSTFRKPSKIVQLVIKYSGGFIANEKQASYVLIGFFVVAIFVSLLLISGSSRQPESGVIPQGQVVPE